MREVFATHAQLADRIATRPAGYAAAVDRAVVRRTDRGVYLDADRLSDVARPPPADPPPMLAPPSQHWGTSLWAELHTKVRPTAKWLADWRRRIGCPACRDHWDPIVADHPPEFGAGWFAWSTRVHNAVNRQLGRPALTLTAAHRRWFGTNP